MQIEARSFLLGASIVGMLVGATLGLVAGAEYRACADSFFAEGATAVCDGYRTLRLASFALVGLMALVALVPLVSELRRPGLPGVQFVWRR